MLALFVVACSAKPQATTGSGSASPGSATTADAAAQPVPTKPGTYVGPPERGPCTDVGGCKLRSVCGCSCEAVILSVPSQVDCDKSCPGADPCAGMTLMCDLATQTCGALPKPP